MNEKRINHEHTIEIVCPYCGHEFIDSWELEPSADFLGLIYCDECEKEFYANRHVEVTYSTEEATYGTCKKCNSENVVIEDLNSSLGKYEDLCTDCGDKEWEKMLKKHLK